MMRLLLCALVATTTACLDPLVSDEVVGDSDLLPAGSVVPGLESAPALRAQIAEHDGVDGLVRLQSGFAAGAPVRYWDFGPTVSTAVPLFVFRQRDAEDNLVPVPDHLNLVASSPGDPGYSPFWAVWVVEVTDAYGGELITSVSALERAQREGLVLAPVPQSLAVNCPTVASDVVMQIDDEGGTAGPDGAFFYEGLRVPYFDLGLMPLEADGVTVPEGRLLRLRREGGEPLSEVVRNVDMTGDGDTLDSNDLLPFASRSNTATPLLRTVSVVVPAGYASIDTAMDDQTAGFRDAAELFDPDPVAGNVVAYDVGGEVRNIVPREALP